MAVEMKREQRMLPTYEPAAPNELPFFLEKKAYQGATGRVYPIPYTDRLSNEPVEKPYDMITLSNEYIEVELLPELGGKIHGAVHQARHGRFGWAVGVRRRGVQLAPASPSHHLHAH